MTTENQNEEETQKETIIEEKVEVTETEKAKHTAPQIPGKTSKGPSFPNAHQFGRGNSFQNNSFNKQRQGRAAGRGR